MSEERYKQLTERLIAKTDRHELDWKETAAPDQFQVSFANYSLVLSRLSTEQAPYYMISIVDSEGRLLDQFTDEDLYTQGLAINDISPFPAMEHLYTQIRRQALGADKALDDILNELERAR